MGNKDRQMSTIESLINNKSTQTINATPYLYTKNKMLYTCTSQNILVFLDQGWTKTPGPVVQPLHYTICMGTKRCVEILLE